MPSFIVPVHVAQKCAVLGSEEAATNDDVRRARIVVSALLATHEATHKHDLAWLRLLARIGATCRALRRDVARARQWLAALGFVLPTPPRAPAFSLQALFVELARAATSQTWQRALLQADVHEGAASALHGSAKTLRELLAACAVVQKKKAAPRKLVICVVEGDAALYFLAELRRLLALRTHPTHVQAADELQFALAEFIKSKQAAGVTKQDVLFDADTALISMASALGADVNDVIAAAIAAALLRHGTRADASVLLVSLRATQFFLGLMYGVDVDELAATGANWNFKKAKAKIPKQTARVVVSALERLSWLALSMMSKQAGLWKQLARSLHLGAEIARREARGDNDATHRVHLALAALRGRRYPADEAAYAADVELQRVLVPTLRRVTRESRGLFEVDDERWLANAFVPDLANAPLHAPRRRQVPDVLSVRGNKRETWLELLDAKHVSAAQALLYARSLVLAGVDAARVGALLRRAPQPAHKLLQVRAVLRATFTDEYVRYMQEEAAKAHAKRRAKTTVRVKEMAPMTVRDKKGQTTELTVRRSVNVEHFKGAETADAYAAMLESALFDPLGAACDARLGAVDEAVIVFTSSLETPVRSGLPPAIPKYTRAALWRNECICLEDLQTSADAPAFRHLVAGITWMESAASGRVDLDLSVVAYTAAFDYVGHVDYTHLRRPGIEHSGDLTSAPPPKGAREHVRIDLAQFKQAHPTARYIVLVVYSYSAQPFDTLDDASVFVADPSVPGDGPGGLSIITAARLTGTGTMNVAGFLRLDEDRTYFFNVDQTSKVRMGSVAQSGTFMQRLLSIITGSYERRDKPSEVLGTWQLAALAAARVAKRRVTIVHDAGGGGVQATTVEADEPRRMFVELERRFMSSALRPALTTRVDAQLATQAAVAANAPSELSRAASCVVIGSELLAAAAGAWAAAFDTAAVGERLVLVDARAVSPSTALRRQTPLAHRRTAVVSLLDGLDALLTCDAALLPFAFVAPDMRRRCALCGAASRLRCSSCKRVYFCSADHQREIWTRHRKECQ